MALQGTIYTVGTSTRSAEEFTRLLTSRDVSVVVDVRRFPFSRFEHFSSENFSRFLRHDDIDYVHMGELLGGYRRGGYQAFITSSEFSEGMDKLIQIASRSMVALVCAERLPWRCHRRFIGSELEKKGWQVIHIIDQERDWQSKRTSVGRRSAPSV
jgi:uncharacterized protein (DUF488 family)